MVISLSDPEKLQLRAERDRFVAFAFAAAELLLEISPDGRIVYAAGATRSFTGVDAAELLRMNFTDIILPEDRPTAAAALGRMRRLGRIDPVMLRLGPGHIVDTIVLSGQTLPNAQENPNLYVAVSAARPVSLVWPQLRHDEETGLLAQKDFLTAAGNALRQAHGNGQSVALDLLEFSGEIQKGAKPTMTATIMAEIGAFLRESSIDGASAGRLAEHRYGVVRLAGDDANDSKPLGEALNQHLRQTGLVAADLPIETKQVDLDRGALSDNDAANALRYAVNRFAEDGVTAITSPTLAGTFRALVEDTAHRITSLKSTMLHGQIEFAFQAIVDLRDRRVQHHEMLARMANGASPFATVQFAESTGLIEEFDLLVCRRAVEQITQTTDPSLKLAVNLSGRSLESAAFIDVLMKLLAPLGKNRPRLLFEVTESIEIADLPKADRVLAALRQQGHQLCLDDFGSGAASLPYLRALTVDYLKIDGSYVKRIDESSKDRAILKAILGMARQLSIETIAEMVETEAQAGLLSALGIGYGQGFLFGRPGALPSQPAPRPARNLGLAPVRGGAARRH